MNSTKKRKFEIEGIISPLAMASLQTQFMVGNRQQFGFLHGDILIADEAYRCDDYVYPNTFYITSVVPVFDAASFQSDLLKSNDKHLSDTFLKHVINNRVREPILGWYFQGKPEELLKGKDYSLHVKLLRQTLLLNKRMQGTFLDNIAYHAFFAAVVSYHKKRFSRDFSVGFQGFDEKNQLRMYEVKVNVVDHYFRPRYETDSCLIDHSKILGHIQNEIESEEVRNTFGHLLRGVFNHPEPDCYHVHGQFVNRCFDLLCGALKINCTRASELRNIELESQLFDYKAFDVDSQAYLAAVTVIDKEERNLNLYSIMLLLNDLDYAQSVCAVPVSRGLPQLPKPQVVAETLEQFRPSPARRETGNVSTIEISPEKVNLPVSSSSGGSDQNSKHSAKVQSPTIHGLVTSIQVTTADVHENATKTSSDDDFPSKASNAEVSKSKKKRKRKSRAASSVSEASLAAGADNSVTQRSLEQNLGTRGMKGTSPFANIPRDQLLVYSITSPNKSNEAKLSDPGSSAAKISQHESDPTSMSSDSNKEEDIADSKPAEMQIRIVKRNTSARVNIPHTSVEEIPNPIKSIKKSDKKNESSDFDSGSHEFVVENSKKLKGESNVRKMPDSAASGNTSSSKHDKVEQTASVIGQDAEHPNKKCKELKYESSQTDTHVPRIVGEIKKPVSCREAEHSLNQIVKSHQSRSSEQLKDIYETSKILVDAKQLPSIAAIEKTHQLLGKRKLPKLPSVVPFLPDTPKNQLVWFRAIKDQAAQQIDQMVAENEFKNRSSGGADMKEINKEVTLPSDSALESAYTITTAPLAHPPIPIFSQGAAEASNSTVYPPSYLNVNVIATAVETRMTATPTTTLTISHEKASTAPLEAPVLVDSSQTVRFKKSKTRKSTSRTQVAADESSKLPWPRSKNACIIIPKIKNVSHTNELWKYALHPIPESLLTALKSLRTWQNEANIEAQTDLSSDSSTNVSSADSDKQLLPDFQEAFGSRPNGERWKSPQSQGKSLPPISEGVTQFPQCPDCAPLSSESKESNRLKRFLSSRRRSLRRKSAFLSTRFASPLETVFEERRSISVEYEHMSPNAYAFDKYQEFIPLCLLGDKFMITAVSTEEKYAALSTINLSDSDTSTGSYSSGES